jgi:hypothetical protein
MSASDGRDDPEEKKSDGVAPNHVGLKSNTSPKLATILQNPAHEQWERGRVDELDAARVRDDGKRRPDFRIRRHQAEENFRFIFVGTAPNVPSGERG